MELQNLPTGQQDYVTIREYDLLYVDKTMFIHRLFKERKSFIFLSRPRRFGKSLFLNTLKEVFLGNKQHFQGLFIENKIEWKKHPVIHFDFSRMGFKELGLAKAIERALEQIATNYGLELLEEGIALKFQELIHKLHEQEGERVVILIDEYDKPLTEYLEFGKEAYEQRDILRNFYGILKGNSAHLRLVFITGISRFSKVSLFSDLNNFSDISFEENYNDICGYTKAELLDNFEPYLKALAVRRKMTYEEALQQVKNYYNGYSWDGENRIYNPYSILRLFDSMQFGNYWFESGTPKFLIQLLKPNFRFELNGLKVGMATFNNYDLSNLNIETLLFQTGYLTIKEKTPFDAFILGYPNQEVEQSMLQYLLMDYGKNHLSPSISTNLIEAIIERDMEKFVDTVNVLFANIPGEIFLAKKEAYYHSTLYISLKLCGFHIYSEVRSSKGRLDAAMAYENRLYIFEFKLDKTAQEALDQIDEKHYTKAFEGQEMEVYKVGINFSSEKKEVDGVLIERVED